VERTVALRLRRAMDDGVLRVPATALVESADLADTPVLLGHDAAGRCLFFEGEPARRCTIHGQLGHDALPVACQQFPRVSVLTPLGTAVSLSHYCPTAAALLFESPDPMDVVEDPTAFPPDRGYDGLDARSALPPLLRPDALLSWEDHARWEAHVVAVLGSPAQPEEALTRLTHQAERARLWKIDKGPLSAWLAATLVDDGVPAETPRMTFEDALALRDAIVRCVPAALRAPILSERSLGEADRLHVAPHWASWSRVVARYLAARAFAGWCAVQGQGLRTAVTYLWVVRAVLRAEAAQACAAAHEDLDRRTLEAAVRAADLLFLHLADPNAVAASVSRVEGKPWRADRPWAVMLAR
jgi:Fe-S-cluster containining protein